MWMQHHPLELKSQKGAIQGQNITILRSSVALSKFVIPAKCERCLCTNNQFNPRHQPFFSWRARLRVVLCSLSISCVLRLELWDVPCVKSGPTPKATWEVFHCPLAYTKPQYM